MGRYYSTSSGRGGKFGFACQSSTDPHDYYGVDEDESVILYSAGEDDVVRIKKKLDEAYAFLGVPEESRTYYLTNDDEWPQYDDYMRYTFKEVKIEDAGDKQQFYCQREGYSNVERKPGAFLHFSRIRLGLVILSDIKDYGYCELTADV